tara:strand:- start:178 stop:1014 length:837 start_codon:yes stop_codon:yes gene_type:complete
MKTIINQYKDSVNLINNLNDKDFSIKKIIKNYTISYLEEINNLIFKTIVSKVDSNNLYTSKQNFDDFTLFLKKDLSKPILKIKLLKISSSINLKPQYGNFLVRTFSQELRLSKIQLLLDITQITKSLIKNQNKILKNILNLEKKQIKLLKSKYYPKLLKNNKQKEDQIFKHDTIIVPNLLAQKLQEEKSFTYKSIFCKRKLEWFTLGEFKSYCPTKISLSKPDKTKYKIEVKTKDPISKEATEKNYYFDTDSLQDFFIQTNLTGNFSEKYINNLLGDE